MDTHILNLSIFWILCLIGSAIGQGFGGNNLPNTGGFQQPNANFPSNGNINIPNSNIPNWPNTGNFGQNGGNPNFKNSQGLQNILNSFRNNPNLRNSPEFQNIVRRMQQGGTISQADLNRLRSQIQNGGQQQGPGGNYPYNRLVTGGSSTISQSYLTIVSVLLSVMYLSRN